MNNINNNINSSSSSSVTKIPNMGFWMSARTTVSSFATMVAAGAVTVEAVSTALLSSSEDLTKLIQDSIGGSRASVEEWRAKCEIELEAFKEDSELYKARQKILNRREWLADLTKEEINSLSDLLKEENK